MNSIILFFIFAGILFVVVGYINAKKYCSSPEIEYRYIPRTFQEEQDNPISVSQLYHDMFNTPTTFLTRMGYVFPTKNSDINRFFISQS